MDTILMFRYVRYSRLPFFIHRFCQNKLQPKLLLKETSLGPLLVDAASEETQKQLARLLIRIDYCYESLERFQNRPDTPN